MINRNVSPRRIVRGAWRLGLIAVLALFTLASAQTLGELRQATEADPGDISAWVQLGNAYVDTGDYDSAKESYLEAVALDYRVTDAHYGLGLSEYGRGDFQAALFAFNEVVRLEPERFDGQFNRAVTLARLRRSGAAAQAFQAALQQAEPEATSEDRINAYLGLAGQLKLNGDFAGAAGAYAGAIELSPGDDELIFLRSDAQFRAGAGLDALPALTQLQSRGYRISEVSATIADVYVSAGQVDRALRALERGLETAQQSGDGAAQSSILVKLGLMQRSLGREADSARSFQQAAEVDDSSWEAHYNLGVSYLESGQTSSALTSLETARGLNDDNGEIHLALAHVYDQLARNDDALASARTAIEGLTGPNLMLQARFILGRALYRQGDFAAAAEQLDQVVQSEANNAQAQLWAGLSQYQLGNFRTASLYYERAVQLDPNSVEARVNLGASYLASERYRDAEVVYQLLVQQNPSDTESFYNLGWSLISQDRRGAARDAWGVACDLGFGPACDALAQYF
jgi:tetratricopeptide (TPR) repeat protein